MRDNQKQEAAMSVQVLEAARAAAAARILEKAAAATTRIETSRLQHEELRRQAMRQRRKMRRARWHKALAGLEAIYAVGQTEPIQKLLGAGGMIRLLHAETTFSNAVLELRKNGVLISYKAYGIETNGAAAGRGGLIDDECMFVWLPFDLERSSLRALRLRRCFSMKEEELLPLKDPEDEAFRRLDMDDAYAVDLLFQVLVDCADPEKLEKHFLRGIR